MSGTGYPTEISQSSHSRPLPIGSPEGIAVTRVFGLDLVRALAITGVLIAHFGLGTALLIGTTTPAIVAMMGHGVELFFVLSGFLIGWLLLDINERSPNLRAWFIFIVRRWMRTVPLYAFWVVVLLVAWPPQGMRTKYALKYLTFTQNFAKPMPLDNWFSVSWSLTVEEWFYLLFSAMLLGIATIWPRRAIALTCCLFITVPLICRLVFASDVTNWDTGLRKIVVYRLDAIAYGVIAAWFYRYHPQILRRWSSVLFAIGAVLAITACRLLYEPAFATLLPWLWSFIPIGFSLCLPAAIDLRSPPRIVSSAIRWLSTRSYGLYIVHLSTVEAVLYIVAKDNMNAWLGIFLFILCSACLAELSFRFIETPILKRRPKQFAE